MMIAKEETNKYRTTARVVGSGLGDPSSIPGGLWGVFMGVWLIVKGFNAPAIASGSAKPDISGDKVILSAA
ncbi:MAG TPA: hypothetical protein VJ821_07395 [Anaerolineales bacterium]|nr:hypothetical protein [Anaerolineales bacterium]